LEKSRKRFTTRDLVYIAVLAAVWAVSENVLGAQLHAMNIPLSGVFLTAVAVFLMVTCKSLVPKIGSVLILGVVVALLRVLSIGSVLVSPMIAILAEAVLVELSMIIMGANLPAAMVGGLLAEVWTFIHPFVVQPLLFGLPMVMIYERTITAGSRALGIDPGNIYVILAVLILLHAALGVIAGAAGWRFSAGVRKTLRR